MRERHVDSSLLRSTTRFALHGWHHMACLRLVDLDLNQQKDWVTGVTVTWARVSGIGL